MGGVAGYTCVFTEGSTPVTVADARDVSLTASGKKIDTSTRGGAGWMDFIQGLKEVEIELEHLWVPSDATYTDLWTAFNTGAKVAFTLVDNATSGKGFSGNMIITKLVLKQPLDGGLMLEFAFAVCGALTKI